MGLRNWFFGASTSEESKTAETPDTDPRDDDDDGDDEQRPYPVETASVLWDKTVTASGTFVRTVELVSATNGQQLIIEYDKKAGSSTTSYSAFDGSVMQHVHDPRSITLAPNYGQALIDLNEQNVLSRTELGSYQISIEQDVHVSISAVRVCDDFDTIPADCMHDYAPRVQKMNGYHYHTDDYVTANNSPSLVTHNAYGWYSHPENSAEPVYVKSIQITDTGDSDVTHDGTTGEIIADTVETGTNTMRAVLANGSVVLPDDVQGLDDTGSDLMRIADTADRHP